MKYITLAAALCIALAAGNTAALAVDHAPDKTAIEKAVESYTTAFNARDAKLLSEHWGPEAIYINPITGSQVEGRDAIEEEFAGILSELGDTKLSVNVDSIRFVSPSVAIENGTATLISPNGEPRESSYTAVHIKRDGKWLLDRVTERDIPIALSHYDQLQELEWMIGSWEDSDDQGRVETTCAWTRNKNFIVRSFTVSVSDEIQLAGMQIIGWDPAAEQIRSWVFDSDGGFYEDRWSKKENRWFVNRSGTMPDGQKSTSVNVITYVDDDQFTWRSINRTVGGELLPNVDEVVVVRKPSAQ